MMELTVNEAMDLVQESNLFESPKRAVLRLLEELQSRRAAEREQAAPEPNSWPLGWSLVQDGGMVRVVNRYGTALAARAIQIESAPVIPRNGQCHDVADTEHKARRNWRAVVDQMTDVQRLVHLAAREVADDERAWREGCYRCPRCKESW